MLVGREGDLERVGDALASAPIVTLWGPAGVGKSALARAALEGEVIACDLADQDDEASLLEALGAALMVEPSPQTPLEVQVGRALGRSPHPVILDNADGVLEPLRRFLGRWVDVEPAPTVLVSARSPLGIDAERAIELAPLAREDALALWRDAGRRLGRRVDPALAEALVERLDRLPAAIEWMASRAAMIGERECLARIEARGFVNDPLRDALAASVDALGDAERGALELVVTFVSGCRVDRLEAQLADALELIDRLARRSLLRLVGAPPRARAYRAVRAHVRARLTEGGRLEALERAHAEMTLTGVESLHDGGPEQRAALRAERSELEAIRARFTMGAPSLALRAGLLLLESDLALGRAAACRERFERLWPELADGDPLQDRARLALSAITRLLGDHDAARGHAEQLLAPGSPLRFEALLERAHVDRRQSRLDAALAGCDEAAELARAGGERLREAIAIGEHGRMLQSLGRPREALAKHAEAIALCHAAQRPDREALERSLHARATHRAGDVDEAIPLHRRALAMHEAAGDRRLAAAERGHLGFCHHEAGELDEAERMFRASVDGLAAVGDVALEHIERVLLARLLVDRGRPGAARLEATIARALVDALDLPRLELTARFVAGLAWWREGDVEAARGEWRAGHALGALLEVGFEALLPAHLALAEARLGEPERADALLETSVARVEALESPGLRAAFAVLRSAAQGEPLPRVDEAILRTSSDARRAVVLTQGGPPALAVEPDGRRARLPDGTEVNLRRRSAPRRVLLALFVARRDAPGSALSRDALIEAGWPGERMLPEAADKRLRTAIWTLRKAGFGELLMTRDDGYLLDPLVPIEQT